MVDFSSFSISVQFTVVTCCAERCLESDFEECLSANEHTLYCQVCMLSITQVALEE